MASFSINLDDKPNLKRATQEQSKLAKEVIQTFVSLMEEAFDPEKGITWADLPGELHKDLTFSQLIKGILRGSLDLKEINPEGYDALKVEVHPLSMLMPRKNYLDGGMKHVNWRAYFQLPKDAQINEQTVADVFRTMLRHTRYVKIERLREALEYNQIATYRGLGDVQMEVLPFYPALRYQRSMYGDLHVGKFFDEIGFLDCGDVIVESDDNSCPACQHEGLETIGKYKCCYACNAGFVVKQL